MPSEARYVWDHVVWNLIYTFAKPPLYCRTCLFATLRTYPSVVRGESVGRCSVEVYDHICL